MRNLNNKKFTVIELLIVIAIVMILASVLLGSLRAAKEKAHQVNCANNFKGCFIGLQNYANRSNGMVPHDPTQSYTNKYIHKRRVGQQNINVLWKDMELKAWMCPRIGKVAPTPQVSSFTYPYSTIAYLAMRFWGGRRSYEISSPYLYRAKNPEKTSILMDRFEVRAAFGALFARYNHGGGRLLEFEGNPMSMQWKFGNKENLGFGANIAFYDGHVQWVKKEDTELVRSYSAPLIEYYGVKNEYSGNMRVFF